MKQRVQELHVLNTFWLNTHWPNTHWPTDILTAAPALTHLSLVWCSPADAWKPTAEPAEDDDALAESFVPNLQHLRLVVRARMHDHATSTTCLAILR